MSSFDDIAERCYIMNQARNGAFALKMRELPKIPETGVEPVYPKGCQILSLVRLPFRHSGMLSNVYPLSLKTSRQKKIPQILPVVRDHS